MTTPEQVFSLANTTALAAWLLLALFPGRPWAARIVAARVVPSILAALYVAIVAATIRGTEGGFSTLAGVAVLFANPWLLLAGWVHYLAFDLLVGAWEAQDARDRRIPHLIVLPCLFLTFTFGPAGWLLYMGVWALRGRQQA